MVKAGKEHSESPNEQQVIESNQNNWPMNLPAQECKQNIHWLSALHASILVVWHFTGLFESTINITVGLGEAASWQNNEEAAHYL